MRTKHLIPHHAAGYTYARAYAFAASAANHLASWLAAAAARGVEQLELHLPRSRLAVLPPSLIACTNLTSLTLRLDHYAHPLPSLRSLTRLSHLHLAAITLAGDNFFADLFSHCKQLRYLVLEKCRIGALCLAGSMQLCSLAITDCSWIQQSSIAFSDMPALRTLHYSGAMASRHIIDNVDSLEEVVLAIKQPQVKLQEPNLRELLTLVGNVHSLMLSPWCIEQFARPEEWSKVRLNNVRQLACVIERREEGAASIAPLLANCQNVEELSVSVVPSQCKRRRGSDDGSYHGVLGGKGAVLRHLRAVRMVYIDESKSGLELVKLLLKNTPMLEMMTIVPSMDGLEQAKFRRRVLKLRKASRDADIQFSATG
uniref:At1g61320/AtMIF1 LRR domain-containing protein n=1 Tax=Oryza brachyantha TaxID=4533 RepID=J3LG20_ORYBR